MTLALSEVDGPRLAHATISVPNMDTALAVYVGLLEQRIVAEANVSVQEAAAWQAPALVGARSVVLQPPSKPAVYLRLIESPTGAGYRPGTHFGWAAIELSVQSADAMHQRLLAANVPIISPPKPLAFTDALYPMQARGPGGEALYLNEIRGNLPDNDLPVARCWVDQLFIAVMGCRDRQRSLDFYNALLGTREGGTWELEYNTINNAFALPSTTRHTLSTLVDRRHVLFEVDQYPIEATPAPQMPGALPPGISHVGVRVSALPKNCDWLSTPTVRHEAPYFGAPVGVLRGPDRELVEIVL